MDNAPAGEHVCRGDETISSREGRGGGSCPDRVGCRPFSVTSHVFRDSLDHPKQAGTVDDAPPPGGYVWGGYETVLPGGVRGGF